MKWIIYSHTDYLDVLQVQSEYSKDIRNKTLLINTLEGIPNSILESYDDFVLYDDKFPYASRLLSLKALKDEHILFIHDMDIVVHKDLSKIKEMEQFLQDSESDRVDLKPAEGGSPPFQRVTDVLLYPYNVNPSIWKLSTFMKIMETFSEETYRTIESMHVQNYCKDLQIYRPHSDEYAYCGYFKCLPWFQFLHITHHGQFMPRSPININPTVLEVYQQICKNYLDKSPRGYKVSMW